MALYNNGYPATYPQMYPQYPQPVQNIGQYQNGVQNLGQIQQNMQPNMQSLATNLQQNQQLQVQNGGWVSVPSEDVARNYPVAPGNSVSFKDENRPYVYVKTMGYSQLDRPVFEKFRLVKESDSIEGSESVPNSAVSATGGETPAYDAKGEIERIWKELEAYKLNMDNLEGDMEEMRSDIAGLFAKKTEVKKK